MRTSSWALASLVWLFACGDDAGDPLSSPSALRATPAGRTVALSWREAGDAPGTAIVRMAGSAPIALPADAALDVGRAFGAGAVVLYAGDGEAHVDTSAEACASYVYQAYAVDGTRRSEPATVSFDGAAAVAPVTAPPASLDASFEDGGVRLVWGEPPTTADHVRIVRRLGSPPTNPDDGVIVATEVSSRDILDPAPGSDGVPGLEAGGTYHYAAYACDACARCETVGARASVATPVAPGDAPTDLVVDPDGATVHFSWNAPDVGGFVTMRLFVRLGAPVEGPDDPEAFVLHEGPEREARIATTTFLPEIGDESRRYHFAVHACAGDSCSEGAAADRSLSLGDVLRGGGYILYFRHAEAGQCIDRTDLGTAAETSTPEWWKSCERSCDVATAEQLVSAGYADAEAAGLALRDAAVPFDRVLASEYCRAVETAERLEIAEPSAVVTREELTPFVHGSDEARCQATLELLGGAALAAPDRNAALVGHGALPGPCSALGGLAPGEAAVFRPSDGGPLLVTRVLPRDWDEAL